MFQKGQSVGRWDAGFRFQSSDSFGFPYLRVMTLPYPRQHRPREANQARQLMRMMAGVQLPEAVAQGKSHLRDEQAENLLGFTKESVTFNDEDLSFEMVTAYTVKNIGRMKTLSWGWLL